MKSTPGQQHTLFLWKFQHQKWAYNVMGKLWIGELVFFLILVRLDAVGVGVHKSNARGMSAASKSINQEYCFDNYFLTIY